MNLALWRKAVSDCWQQLALSCVLLMAFTWVFIWWMSHIPTEGFATFLNWMPGFMKSLISVKLSDLATRSGQLTILYVHVITMLVCVGWAVGRGSDSVSGEIARGTMGLLLTLPVRRAWVLIVPAVVASLGAVLLCASLLCGTAIGLATVNFSESISVWKYVPGAVNLFAMTFCLTGITTFISSWNRDRWRTIALSTGIFIFSYIVEMVQRVWQEGWWLKYCTFLSAFHPQEMILEGDAARSTALWNNGALLTLGVLGFVAGGIILARRDIPAPQ
jgi:ABC-2 type transport system permease protein